MTHGNDFAWTPCRWSNFAWQPRACLIFLNFWPLNCYKCCKYFRWNRRLACNSMLNYSYLIEMQNFSRLLIKSWQPLILCSWWNGRNLDFRDASWNQSVFRGEYDVKFHYLILFVQHVTVEKSARNRSYVVKTLFAKTIALPFPVIGTRWFNLAKHR